MDSQSRVVILCGKGGVGKTTVSLALGLRHAQLNRKVVIVSSHPLEELALAVSLDGLARQYPVAARNLFIVHLDARELLDEVIRNNFPVDWMAKRVINSRLYQNLMEVAPGLKEFHFLAHLQQLAERKVAAGDGDSRAYDLLLWDAPATGHFLSTLRSARNFRSYLTGPLASAGEHVSRFYSTMENVTLLPVTIPEEMPIEETVELCGAMETEFQLKPAAVLVNLASPLLDKPGEEKRLERAAAASNGALRFALDRAAAERERVDSLRARVPAPLAALPRIVHWSSDLDMVAQLSAFLELPGLQAGAP